MTATVLRLLLETMCDRAPDRGSQALLPLETRSGIGIPFAHLIPFQAIPGTRSPMWATGSGPEADHAVTASWGSPWRSLSVPELCRWLQVAIPDPKRTDAVDCKHCIPGCPFRAPGSNGAPYSRRRGTMLPGRFGNHSDRDAGYRHRSDAIAMGP